MDLKLNRNEITLCDIASMSGEQSFESDILLPDYYEDIMKILKCAVSPEILKTNASGDRITIEGIVVSKIYYQSIENEIRTIQTKTNFSKVFEIRNSLDNVYPKATIFLDYVNCRAINERRMDVKGALSIKLKLFCNNKESIMIQADGLGLQTKNNKISNMVVRGSNNNTFTIKEDIELPNNKPDIGNIIRYNVTTNLTDKKIINNKIIFKGDVKLDILYSPFDNDLEPMFETFYLSMSQIIDLPGLDEACECELSCKFIWAEITPRADSNGRNRLISAELNFNVGAKAHNEIETNIIVDAYSTVMNTHCSRKSLNCYKILNYINEKIAISDIVNTSYNNLKIYDMWNTPRLVIAKKVDGEILIEGKSEISILCKDGNAPIYLEKTIDFETRVPIDVCNQNNENMQFDLDVETISMSYEVNYDSINIKVDLAVKGYVYQNKIQNVLSNIEVDESQPKNRADRDSLIVYYAQPGEDVWELAKEYNTSSSAILVENEGLEEGIIKENRMLLIPIVVN